MPSLTRALRPWPRPSRPLRYRARDVVAGALWAGGHKSLQAPAGTLTVVTLHRFLPPALRRRYPYPPLAVTPDGFRRMLSFFGTHFRVLPVSDALDAWDAGERDKPLLSITVDDGQFDNLRYAAPLLKQAGLRATFYIPTDAVDEQRLRWPDRRGYGLMLARAQGLDPQPLADAIDAPLSTLDELGQAAEAMKLLTPAAREAAMRIVDGWLEGARPSAWGRLMTWDEIRHLAEEGHEIGGHSRTHPILPRVDDVRLADEVGGCMTRLREEMGTRPVRSFAYPNGDTDDRVCAAVRAAGFDNAVTCEEGRADPAGDRLRLRRIDLQEELAEGPLGHVDNPALAFRLRDRR